VSKDPTERDPTYYRLVRDCSPRFRSISHNPAELLLRRSLRRYARPGLRVLDVGCGVGIGAVHLADSGQRGVEYVGIDPDDETCRKARAVLAALPAKLIQGQVRPCSIQEYLASSPPRADLILWSYSFHECVDADDPDVHVPVVAQVAQLLSPGGILIIGDPFVAPGASAREIEAIKAESARAVGSRGRPFFSPRVIKSLFTNVGLALVETAESPLLYLGAYLNLAHARFGVSVFSKDSC
jgi:SAM-dependent methyltransferase